MSDVEFEEGQPSQSRFPEQRFVLNQQTKRTHTMGIKRHTLWVIVFILCIVMSLIVVATYMVNSRPGLKIKEPVKHPAETIRQKNERLQQQSQ